MDIDSRELIGFVLVFVLGLRVGIRVSVWVSDWVRVDHTLVPVGLHEPRQAVRGLRTWVSVRVSVRV